MKKLFCLLLCSLLCAGLFAGCGGLSDNYDEEEVVSLAHAVVENLNAKDYDAVVAGMSDEMKEALPPTSWRRCGCPLRNSWALSTRSPRTAPQKKTALLWSS